METWIPDSLPSEPPGKPKNTGVGSLSLLKGIFPTQESTGFSYIAGRFFTSWTHISIETALEEVAKGFHVAKTTGSFSVFILTFL